ncbi:SymE family type I addiction module toxin [Pectobacterium actinidiae]|uniref:SymE family type I addiction module toxin n=1 Tax=Pectobacterium actinidiae TaxID=1507808 RepID=UPI0040407E07
MQQHTRTADHNRYLKEIVIMTDVACIAVCENEKARSVTYRHLTVSYAGRHWDNVYTPVVVMKGLWLEAAGFTVGAKVDVQVMRGCILLTTRQPPRAGNKNVVRAGRPASGG